MGAEQGSKQQWLRKKERETEKKIPDNKMLILFYRIVLSVGKDEDACLLCTQCTRCLLLPYFIFQTDSLFFLSVVIFFGKCLLSVCTVQYM